MHVRSLPCLGPRPPFFCLGHSHFSRKDNVFHLAWGHLLKPEHALLNQRREIDLFLFTNVYCFRTFLNGAHKNYYKSSFHYKKNKLISGGLNSTQHTTDRMPRTIAQYFQQQPALISPSSAFTSYSWFSPLLRYGCKSYFRAFNDATH